MPRRLTQWSFQSDAADLEGRSGEQDGPRQASPQPGASGACASQWGRCWQRLSSCWWGWDCCSRCPCTLDFHRPVNPKYSACCCDQSFSHFVGCKLVGWACARGSEKWKIEAKGSESESAPFSPSVWILATSVKTSQSVSNNRSV